MPLIDFIKIGEPMPQEVPNITAPYRGNGRYDSAVDHGVGSSDHLL